MSNFDWIPEMKKKLLRRIKNLFGIKEVECVVFEQMSDDMQISYENISGVSEFYSETTVMTDEELQKKFAAALQKVKKKKEVAGVC